MSKLIQAIEQEQLRHDIPEFSPGDTVIVNVKVTEIDTETKGKGKGKDKGKAKTEREGEGSRGRAQAFEGIVIAIKNRGVNSSFTVRKISHGEGVERVFITHSPAIESVSVKRRGDVRRAKLYYLRKLSGRAARIREKLPTRQTNKDEQAAS